MDMGRPPPGLSTERTERCLSGIMIRRCFYFSLCFLCSRYGLIQEGFLSRTPRGRLAAPIAYKHFGISMQAEGEQGGLL